MNMMNVENSNIAYELQKRLIQCCIDFVNETGNKDIDEVLFNVDCLQVSVNVGKWHPGTAPWGIRASSSAGRTGSFAPRSGRDGSRRSSHLGWCRPSCPQKRSGHTAGRRRTRSW